MLEVTEVEIVAPSLYFSLIITNVIVLGTLYIVGLLSMSLKPTAVILKG